MKILLCFVLTALFAQADDYVKEALARQQVVCGTVNLRESVFDHYFNEIVRKDLAADAAWAALETPEAIRSHQQRIRAAAVAALGGFPARCPLNLQTTGRIQRKGYVIEKVLFESRPKHYVSAHLFLPDDPKFKAPYPGIISPCGHSRSGKNAPWYQRPGVIGATHGFATLVYDPIDQGERRQYLADTNENWSTTVEHNRCGVRAALLGWNTAEFRIWDGMRAIDALLSRPDVAGPKVGVMGISGGGTLSSYIMALDDRVGAACPAGYLTTMRALCCQCGPQDAEQQFFGQLGFGLNHLGLVLLRAPSPVMINATHNDFFPFHGTLDTFGRAQAVYEKLGAREAVALFSVPGPHHWYESEQQASTLWMRRWLVDDRAAYPFDSAALERLDVGFEYANVDTATADLAHPQRHFTADGAVTPGGYVMRLPGARSVYDILQDEFARARAARGALDRTVVRRLAGIRPAVNLLSAAYDVRETTTADGVKVSAATLVTPENFRIPTVAFLPSAVKGSPLLFVTDAARATLAPRVKAALAQGRPALVAELRCFGETGALRRQRTAGGFYGCKDEDEEVAMMCTWLGLSLVGQRAEDLILAAKEFLRLTGGVRAEIVAEGRAAVPAAHAHYVEPNLFAGLRMERPPLSWTEVMADPGQPYRFANVVQGALRAYDWTDLVQEP